MLAPQDVADAFNAAGIDTPDKLAALFRYVVPLVQRNQIQSAIDAARAERDIAVQAAEARIQDLSGQITAIDAALASQI